MRASRGIPTHLPRLDCLAVFVVALSLPFAAVQAKSYETGELVTLGEINAGAIVLSGRFNADSLDDVAVVFGNDVQIRVQTPGGGFVLFYSGAMSDMGLPYFGCPAASCSVVSGDVNSDGIDDIVVSNWGGLVTYLSDPVAATFSPVRSFLQSTTGHLATADLDGDGDLDLVNADAAGGLRVLRNDVAFRPFDTSALLPVAIPVNGSVLQVSARDLDSDGRPDVVILSKDLDEEIPTDTHRVSVFRNLGPGAFQFELASSFTFHGGGVYPGMDVGDVNDDGRPDIVVTHAVDWPESNVSIHLQDALGQFGAAIPYESLDMPSMVVIDDVDGDSLADLTINHRDWSSISTYRQEGGALTLQFPFADASEVHNDRYVFAVGDFDNDACKDLVIDAGTGYRFLDGRGCASKPSVDLAVSASADEQAARVVVGNSAGSAASGPTRVQVDFQTRQPSLAFVSVPAGCVRSDVPPVSVSFSCAIADLAPGGQSVLVFGYGVKQPGRIDLDLRAWVTDNEGHDPTPGNNTAGSKLLAFPRRTGPVVPGPGPVPVD